MPAERRPAPAGARSARSSYRLEASGSRAVAVTSMRWGNGNAGASTSIDARNRAVAPRVESSIDRPTGLPDQEPVDRQTVVVDRQCRRRRGRRSSPGRGSADPRGGSPTARAGADPSCARRGARRAHPAAPGARPRGIAARRPSCRGRAGTPPTTRRPRARPPARRGSDARARSTRAATRYSSQSIWVASGRLMYADARVVGDVVPGPGPERLQSRPQAVEQPRVHPEP